MRELFGLEKAVMTTLMENTNSLEELQYYMEDIINHGCISGCVPQLIYARDCESFVKEHLVEILDTLQDMIEESIIESAPCDVSLMSWWALEYITKKLYDEIDWEEELGIEAERTIEAEIYGEEM